jgi:glutathionyl-hydroquinone reductase
VLNGVVTVLLDQAYYLLTTDESIPLAHRQVLERKELRHVDDVLVEYVHLTACNSGEHMREIMQAFPPLTIEMMVNYVSTAYSRELAQNSGGVTPELWAKQLQLAIPVRSSFNSDYLCG